jgi:hypothetical protein
MTKYRPNPAANVEKIAHQDPEICVYVVDDFMENPQELVDYAKSKAYFGKVGADRTAYPGIRDRLPSNYERALAEVMERVFPECRPIISRCMLSLTTLDAGQLHAAQKIPHVDTASDDQYASVHYLCDQRHGGTALYRYLPRNTIRIRSGDGAVVQEMIQAVHDHPEEHQGYLIGNTQFYKQELVVEAKFNRLVIYPGNLLHCALLTSPESLNPDASRGRLTVASFFKLSTETFVAN